MSDALSINVNCLEFLQAREVVDALPTRVRMPFSPTPKALSQSSPMKPSRGGLDVHYSESKFVGADEIKDPGHCRAPHFAIMWPGLVLGDKLSVLDIARMALKCGYLTFAVLSLF